MRTWYSIRECSSDIPNNRETKIALIIPVQNILKEEAETLTLPLANKRAKSPTSTCDGGHMHTDRLTAQVS